jgi:hypothetical protein
MGSEMPQDSVEPLLAVPAFMECLKYMHELPFGEPVDVRHDCVELGDHILLFPVMERTALDTDSFGPGREAVVRRC